MINKPSPIQAIERNELLRHEKPQRNLICILLRERSQPGRATRCMIPSMRLSGKANEEWLSELERRRMNRLATKDFQNSETIRCVLQWWTHVVIHFVQTCRMYNTKSKH
jgi:hypothetical protein